MPASTRARMVSGDDVLGPSVHTILEQRLIEELGTVLMPEAGDGDNNLMSGGQIVGFRLGLVTSAAVGCHRPTAQRRATGPWRGRS